MSGICGLFYRDGRPVAGDALKPVVDAMASWGPDGARVRCEGSTALGHLALHTTPESVTDQLPAVGRGGQVLTATSRLDNRTELASSLGMDARAPDSSLILAAYEKWGRACCDHLLGDWSFAVWDPGRRELYVARDHHGNTALFYHESPQLFAFASSLKALLALPGVSRDLSEEAIAGYFVVWPGVRLETPYRRVHRLFPAHSLSVGPASFTVRQYWSLEDLQPLELPSDQAYQEAFRDVLATAVRSRIGRHRSVGLLMSGGLDSTTVAALAAPALRESGRRLTSFSSVPLHGSGTSPLDGRYLFDETPRIRAVAEHVGNIDVVLDCAGDTTPVAGLRRMVEILGEPFPNAANAYWILSLLDRARAAGIDCMLDGDGGNVTISWAGTRLHHELARRGRLMRLYAEVASTPRPLRELALALLEAWAPGVLVAWSWLRTGSGPQDWAHDLLRLAPLRRELVAKYHLKERLEDASRLSRGRHADLRARCKLAGLGQDLIGFVAHPLAAEFAMDMCSPALDRRVIELCLAIPAEQWRQGTDQRRLVRGAMAGRLPADVARHTLRGLQSADIVARLRSSADEVDRALVALDRSPTARVVLDVGKMRKVLEGLTSQGSGEWEAESRHTLMTGLSVGLFLKSRD